MNFRSCSALLIAALIALPAVFAVAQAQQQPTQGQAQTRQQTRQGQRQQNRQGLQNRQIQAQPQQQPRPRQSPEELLLNDRQYFERQGVNVLVFSNAFTGGFNDEKNAGIEIIHHGVRTVQGGAVRLSKTPEQASIIPMSISNLTNV